MARPQVYDTSALVEALRRPEQRAALWGSLASGHVWLSSVVVAEIYAGTRSPDEATFVARVVQAMERVDRLLTPIALDWIRAGRLIGRRTRLHGAVRPRDHLADVLILLSAARLGAVVVTANLRHFEAWERLAKAAGLDVVVRSSLEPP